MLLLQQYEANISGNDNGASFGRRLIDIVVLGF